MQHASSLYEVFCYPHFFDSFFCDSILHYLIEKASFCETDMFHHRSRLTFGEFVLEVFFVFFILFLRLLLTFELFELLFLPSFLYERERVG